VVEKDGQPLLELTIAGGQAACPGGNAEESVAQAAASAGGRFHLVPGADQPGDGSVPLAGLVLASARAIKEVQRIRDALGSLQCPLGMTEAGSALAAGLSLKPWEGFLLSRIDGTSSILEICQVSPAREENTLRSIYGLAAAGVIKLLPRREAKTRADDPAARLSGFLRSTEDITQTAVREPAAAAEPERSREYEILEQRIKDAEHQNHYEILGVPEHAHQDELRQTFFALARTYHPDRFHRPEVRELQPEMEKLFARMTGAYQILTEPLERAQYDRSLNLRPDVDRSAQQAAVLDLAKQNYKAGKKLAADGKLAKALTFLEQAVKHDPSQAEYFETLGAVQALNPRLKAHAEANLERAIRLAPSRASTFLTLGLFYAKNQRPEEAERMLRQAVSWDADCTPAQMILTFLDSGGQGASEGAGEMIRQLLQQR
jgi:curved DNA-binding protein CbpA